METSQFPKHFRASSPYIREHRDKLFVLLLPSSINGTRLKNLVRDLALLQVLEIRLVLVVEVSCEDAEIVLEADRLTTELEELFSRGLPSSRYRNQKIPVLVKDLAERGAEDSTDNRAWYPVSTLSQTHSFATYQDNPILLVRPITRDQDGLTRGVPVEDAAVAVATHLGADKLIVLLDSMDQDIFREELSSDLSVEAFAGLVEDSPINPATQRTLDAVLRACRNGVQRGHIVSGIDDGALLTELFTADGSGTQVSNDEYLTIRSATQQDTEVILELMHDDVRADSIVPRTNELLLDPKTTVFIAEHDERPVGCVALYKLEEDMQEIGTLIAASKHRDQNIGSRLLARAEKEAIQRGAKKTYVFTKHAVSWFQNHDYDVGDLSALPPACSADYNEERGSTLLIKSLT